METKRMGERTVTFSAPPAIIGFASVAGKKEGEGPLGNSFDYVAQDTTMSEKSWEKAESRMQREALDRAIVKAKISASNLRYVFAGDLINQCIVSAYGIRGMETPFVGLYGACSTMAESLMLASMAIDGEFAQYAAAVTSSHFASAERQYRFPLEYGGQRPPTAQWTVTGAGAVVLAAEGPGPYVTRACAGKIVDFGISDANNMGAAMAPAIAIYTQCLWNEKNTRNSCIFHLYINMTELCFHGMYYRAQRTKCQMPLRAVLPLANTRSVMLQ